MMENPIDDKIKFQLIGRGPGVVSFSPLLELQELKTPQKDGHLSKEEEESRKYLVAIQKKLTILSAKRDGVLREISALLEQVAQHERAKRNFHLSYHEKKDGGIGYTTRGCVRKTQ